MTNDISYSATNVKPGNYKLAVTFYGENNTKIGYWSDLVIIAPGYIQTIAELNIPDVIMKKPSAPSTVYAYRVVDSEKDGLYKVRIDWADSSTNEENFVINIYKYSSAAADATVTLYKSLGVDAVDGVTEPFFTSGTYAGGSIYAGNTNATIYLPTGELFDVKVQAQNFAGKSAETARTEPTGENPSGFEKYTAAQKINRVLVAYNLNGGTFVSDTKTVIGGFLEEYFTYPETQTYVTGKDVENNDITATGHKLLSIKPASGSVNPKLTYNNHDFNGWRATVTSDTVLNGYSDYKNYSVIATFNLDVNLSYAVASYATFTADEVTITKDVSGTATTVIGGTANLTDEITVTVTIASPSKYDWYQIDLDGTPIYYGASNTFSFTPDSIHGLTAGTKNIVVYARLVGTVDTWVADDYTVTFGN